MFSGDFQVFGDIFRSSIVKRRTGIYTMKIYVNNIFSESRDRTDIYRDNMDVLWGNLQLKPTRNGILKEVVSIIKYGNLIVLFFLKYFVLRDQCIHII